MLVVLASRDDTQAARWVARLGDAALITPADLSRSGWALRVPPAPDATIVARGERRPLADVRGVVVRLEGVSEAELPWIHADDRAYVAAEMTAFLAAWLAQLEVPVLNPPRGASLCGPGWRPERWLLEASRAGIPIHPFGARVAVGDEPGPDPEPSAGDRTVTVLAGEAVGGTEEQAAASRRLAERARCPLVRAHFLGEALIGADSWADLDDPAVLGAATAWAVRL